MGLPFGLEVVDDAHNSTETYRDVPSNDASATPDVVDQVCSVQISKPFRAHEKERLAFAAFA
jgi:hypothetical protein